MNSNQLMTAGAIGFAAYALYQFVWQSSHKVTTIANQPGQQQRDAGLLVWNQQQLGQWAHMDAQTGLESFPQTAALLKGQP